MGLKPKKLSVGGTIGIISPAYLTKQEQIKKAVDTLTQKGFKVKFSKNLFKDTHGYAASPQERADDFNEMILDPEVEMLLFSGGEVCNEILPYVDFDAVKKNPKILASYSDTTTIMTAVTALTEMVTYYGQALCTFNNLTDYNNDMFQSVFIDNTVSELKKNSEWKIIHEGKCEGILMGGYLANFAIMQNGKYFKYNKDEKYILVIEDHMNYSEESVVSKYFSHIEQSGLFNNVSGLIFGHYSIEPKPLIEDILKRISMRYDIPVVKCDDFGHGENNAVFPMGIRAVLDTYQKTLIYKEKLLSD